MLTNRLLLVAKQAQYSKQEGIEVKKVFPVVRVDNCKGCGKCTEVCPADLLIINEDRISFIFVEEGECLYCGACEEICPYDAIRCPIQIVVV